jgi:hypothetical protein
MSKYRQSDTPDTTDLLAMIGALRRDIGWMIEKAIKPTSLINEEQFLAEVMTGKCPRCGSGQIKDCRRTEPINDVTVGLCMKCGHLWCLECGRSLVVNVHCNHWCICLLCDKLDTCNIDLRECSKLKERV